MRIIERLQWIKYTILIGLFSSVCLSYNLWAGQRWFPKVPLLEGFSTLQAPYDYVYLIVLLLFIATDFILNQRWTSILLILFSVFLILEDENRLQPWFYEYLIMLFVLAFYKRRVDDPNNYISVFVSLQMMLALIYIFSGIQKMNANFMETYSWFVHPLKSMISDRQFQNILRFGHIVPYLEALIGIGLLIKPIRFITISLAIFMHVFILLMLGPIGNSYNYVVWPWNLIMITLCLLLFSGQTKERYFSISYLFKNLGFYTVIGLMLIMPLFSLKNDWPSYLSNSLYSGNTDDAKIILSDKALNSLPYYIRNFVVKNSDYNLLYIKTWCITELKTPCYPEKEVFDGVKTEVEHLTGFDGQDVRLEYKERQKILK